MPILSTKNIFEKILSYFFFILEKENINGENIYTENDIDWKNYIKTSGKYGDVDYFFEYQNPFVKKTILAVKEYGDKKKARSISKVLSDLLLEELSEKAELQNFLDPIIIPVPISKKDWRQKGFNHSEIFAKHISKLLKLKLERKIVHKKHSKKHQHFLTKEEREKNIVNTFIIKKPKKIEGKNIILIDDVVTTGATMKELKKTLTNSGARHIWPIAIAH